MRKFNLSEIMNKAHRLYKNTKGKYTWSDALAKSWKMAKFNMWMKEQSEVIKQEEAAKVEKEREEKEQAAIRTLLFNANLKVSRIKQDAEAKAESMREAIAAHKEGISIEAYRERLSFQMGYNRGNNSYCGD